MEGDLHLCIRYRFGDGTGMRDCGSNGFGLKSGCHDGNAMKHTTYKTVIVGAGPAGLTAAYELAKHGQSVVVLEADPEYVGGISRTVNYKGFHFDIGGHRFFSKSQGGRGPVDRNRPAT